MLQYTASFAGDAVEYFPIILITNGQRPNAGMRAATAEFERLASVGYARVRSFAAGHVSKTETRKEFVAQRLFASLRVLSMLAARDTLKGSKLPYIDSKKMRSEFITCQMPVLLTQVPEINSLISTSNHEYSKVHKHHF
ncbi:MAG: hypothetical protein RIE60_22600 [Roseovarius sp.]